jgi:hypothetical protein
MVLKRRERDIEKQKKNIIEEKARLARLQEELEVY